MVIHLGRLTALVSIGILALLTAPNLLAHDYPHLVKVKVGTSTTFHVADNGDCAATVWIEAIQNESLFTITPMQGFGIVVEFTVEANMIPGETMILVHWTGEHVGSDEGHCKEDTRDFGGVAVTVRVTPDKVNSTGDDQTAESGDGHCDTGNNIKVNGEETPECTLRAAIQEVNAGGWEGVIRFDIQGPSPHTIMPGSPYPGLKRPVLITGFSSGGSKESPLSISSNPPGVIINGSGAAGGTSGLTFTAGAVGSTVEGLSIIGFSGNGMIVATNDMVIKSNYIGITPYAASATPNTGSGILISSGISNRIGGANQSDRNVIVGNMEHGVSVINGSQNLIIGNWIGFLSDSSNAAGNEKAGVHITGGSNNAVGGPADYPGRAPGNVISGNGSGIILLNSNEVLVRGNVIGDAETDPEMESRFHNLSNGIQVQGLTIAIGGTDERAANVIARNGENGVFITGNDTRGVSVRRNNIYLNTGLGIDLFPPGVNQNDSLDTDTGPNDMLNFPKIDSLRIPSPLIDGSIIQVFGSLHSKPNRTYSIDVYISDSCDPSKYGEGQTFLGTGLTNTDAQGNGTFTVTFVSTGDKTYSSSKAITAATTDNSGSTSEFSLCSRPTLLLVDVEGEPIKNRTFLFYKVNDNKPIYTETFIDSLETNNDGIIYRDSINADHDDLILIRRIMERKKTSKALSPTITSYNVTLNNVTIKEEGEHEFLKIDTTQHNQRTELKHTVITFNLSISIEWRASQAYVQQMQHSLRRASNYLYNVSDGQMRLDTVTVYTGKFNWNHVDVRYHASNVQWPVATVSGITNAAAIAKIEMPRRWFGSEERGRNDSIVSEGNLNLLDSHEYRTLIHEFGHYGLSLYDEYQFTNNVGRCAAVPHYGFMDSQYAGVPNSNDMSWNHYYTNKECQNNNQYANRKMGSWEYVKNTFEKVYDDLKVPIITPDQRELPDNVFGFTGPNENFASLSYDVGSRVVFQAASAESPYRTQIIKLVNARGDSIPNINVSHFSVGENRSIVQGRTSNSGLIAILGYANNDRIEASGRVRFIGGRKILNADDDVEWYSGLLTEVADELVLSVAEGIRPILPGVVLYPDGFNVEIVTEAPNDLLPEVSVIVDDMVTDVHVTASANGFMIQHAVDETQYGYFQTRALDANGTPFFFNTPFMYFLAGIDGEMKTVQSTGGDFSVNPENPETFFERALILSSEFPVPTTGLEETSVQVSRTHSLSYESNEPVPAMLLNIRYDDAELPDNDSELLVKIFRWSESANRWEYRGGGVDTLHNSVSAIIAESGIYAAFTTTIAVSTREETDVGPHQFRLYHNYPNPFNPATNITFDVAVTTPVQLEVFDVLGRRVAVLVNETKIPGHYTVNFNARALASGVYIYRIQMGNFVESRTMMLIK